MGVRGPADDSYYEAELQDSSLIDEETHWTVSIGKSDSGGTDVWNESWSYNGVRVMGSVFKFSLSPRGSRHFKLKGSSRLLTGWLQIGPDEAQTRRYPSAVLSASQFLQIKRAGVFLGSIGMPTGQWSKSQITAPVVRSRTSNTGVAVIVFETEPDRRRRSPEIVYTLFDSAGEEFDRVT